MTFDARAYMEYFGFRRIKDRGPNLMASCPDFNDVHPRGDMRPSFGLHKVTGLANCFACDTHLNLEQLTAKLLSKETGEPVNEFEAWAWLENKDWMPKELTAEEILEQLRNLGVGNEGNIIYEDSILDEYVNGVHPSILREKNITLEAAMKWELRFDKISRRTIIPVRSELGPIVGCLSRAVDEDNFIRHAIGIPQPSINDEPQPNKYTFQKKLVLYGENRLKGSDTIFVIESPLDVVYGDGYGAFNNFDVGALMGTKLSPVNLERLLGYETVILGLDNDQPGQDGQSSIINQLIGKVRLYVFDHYGAKDLGVVPRELLSTIRQHSVPVLQKKLFNIPFKE